jgi:uncharacterized protein (DUF427 family)
VRNVWDFPRPPAVEPCLRRVRIELGGRLVVDSTRALEVLETSHPPVIYVPLADVAPGVLEPSRRRTTWCEFKGTAHYYDAGDREAAAWGYATPAAGYEALTGHVAFYPGRMDACFLDEERVRAQEGDFYGGWITADIAGPLKGGPGTRGW